MRDIYDFIVDRLRGYLLDGQAPGLDRNAVTPEVFEAVRARAPASPLDFCQRVTAVREFVRHDAAESLAAANKRIANILKSAQADPAATVEPALFQASEEDALFASLQKISTDHATSLERRDYGGALERLATLKDPVDAFFDGVMVMTDDADQQRNRIALLTQLRQRFLDVADLSCIPTS